MDKATKKQLLLDAYRFRHACKLFDETQKISKEDFEFILECGRLSPTSFGMQGVRLEVITNQELKEQLRPLCWNQPQITSCSHLVIFKTKTTALKPDSEWVKERFSERGLPEEALNKYLEVYKNFHTTLKCDDIYEWGARQAYILLSSMITAAAYIEIDSCPIEGFSKQELEQALDIDTQEEEIALVCCFGYRKNEQPQKLRLPLEEICEFRV